MTKKKKKKKTNVPFFPHHDGVSHKNLWPTEKMLKGTRAFENTNRAKGGAFFEMKKKKQTTTQTPIKNEIQNFKRM